MRVAKFVLPAILGFLLGFANAPSSAMQAVGQKTVKGEKIAGPKKARESAAPSHGTAGTVRKGAELVRKVEGGYLYTDSGRYSLSGVKVIDLSINRRPAGGAVSTPRKTAEMTFLNHQLKEVVIRQR